MEPLSLFDYVPPPDDAQAEPTPPSPAEPADEEQPAFFALPAVEEKWRADWRGMPKAQNKSLLLFSGEAYNVEQGISNELFTQERDETPAPATRSTDRGRQLFTSTGCALCHTPTLKTGSSDLAAFNNKNVNLFSDLMLHGMGPGLADDILQGSARGDEFRTAPLWGLGQRIFFLHDGRTTDLKEAIVAHRSAANSKFPASEANQVVGRYLNLEEGQKQDLLNFLRSL